MPPRTTPPETVEEEIRFDPATPSFPLLPPGSDLPSGEECAARVTRNPWEPVPANEEANQTVGGQRIESLPGVRPPGRALVERIDGNFTGTTDEIIQWASCKWGIDTDSVRAQADTETTWQQSAVGDDGQSFGILQIKRRFHPWAFPAARRSTAFNLDYSLALWRLCYEGYLDFLPDGARGNKNGCHGWHWSGEWMSEGGKAYVERIQEALAARRWEGWPNGAVTQQ